MKRTLLAIAFLFPTVQGITQQPPSTNPASIAAKITSLWTLRDTTVDGSLLPEQASLSPRATLVAYTTAHDVRLWNAKTRATTILLHGWVESLVWAPTGDAIAFARPDDQGSQEFVWMIRLDPVTGKPRGTPQRVSLSATTAFAPQFSPNGKFIAFPRRDAAGRSSLVVVPKAGGPERILAAGYAVSGLSWRRDGSAIYFVMRPDSTLSNELLYRVALAGGPPRLMYDGAASWAPDVRDERLVVPGPSSVAQHATTLADWSGKTLAVLTRPSNITNNDYSADYRAAGVRQENPRGILLTDLSDGRSRVLIDTTAEAGPPTWFADGRRLAAIVRDNGIPSLVTIDVDGTRLRSIPLKVAPLFTPQLRNWVNADLGVSPDGRYAVYLGETRQSLELVDLASGDQRTLAHSSITITRPIWRKDSRTIRYILDGAVPTPNTTRSVHDVTIDGADKLVRMLPFSELPGAATMLIDENTVSVFGPGSLDHRLVPLNGGPTRVVLPTTVQNPGYLSPDGRTIVNRLGRLEGIGDARPTRRLTFFSLADSTRRDVELPFTDVPLVDIAYHPDGRRVFVAGRDAPGDPVSIYSVSLDDSAPRVVARADTKEMISMFRLSPDGRYIAYTVAAAPRATFLILDYTEGVSKLPASSPKP
jgi:Tol biopolymer transport system component